MLRENVSTFTGKIPGLSMQWILALYMLLGMAGASHANSILYTGDGFNDANSGVTFAMEISPAVDILVTDLGVFDGGLDGPGMLTAHDVGLWTFDGTLLATTTVDNGAALQNGFRFTSIVPVALSAGQTYILGAYFPQDRPGDKLIATILSPSSLISLSGTTRYAGGPGLTFPANPANESLDFRIATNLLFTTAVPVPPALWLFTTGLLGLVGVSRRKAA